MSLKNAIVDIRYLLNRGYPHKGVIRFVGNHYRLDEETRLLISRTVLPNVVSEERRKKFLSCDDIAYNKILIDGYNIIIGMESILEKKAYLCDDGVIRDTKGVFRNYHTSNTTEKAINFILDFLKEKNPSYICFLLDSQISKSGLLAKYLRNKIKERGLRGYARTSKHVDYDLKNSEYVVVSNDGVIIDDAKKVVNLLRCVVERFGLKEGVLKVREALP